MKSNQRYHLKAVLAVIGASAVITMGVATVALHDQPTGPGATLLGSAMNLGGTTTETTPPTAPATPFASPAVKASPAAP